MSDITIMRIRELCENKVMRWTNHIHTRLIKRNILIEDVEESLLSGEIIELYPDDYPYPSCLVLGTDANNNYVHVVCGISGAELHLITAYYPNPAKWSADFKVRREKN